MPTAPYHDDRFWNRLLRSIEDGQVVPVVGSQLLVWGEPGNAQSLQRLLAMRLLEMRDIDWSGVTLSPYRELYDAVTLLKSKISDLNLQELYGDIADALDVITHEANFRIPQALTDLAAITHFRLFVTLSPDGLLAQALRERCAVNEFIHSPNLPTSEAADLAPDWLKRPNEVNLLYLFGKVRSQPFFAIHDEDVLEYAHNLLSRGSNVPLRFLDELKQRNLLLIGCNFPDWLSRFFMRLTNLNRLADKKTRAWLIEEIDNQPDLTLFLTNFSRETVILSDIRPQTFVAELHARWLKRNRPAEGLPPAPPESDPRGAIFFISYSRATDLPAVKRLLQALLDQGVAENEIWFDQKTIEPGQDFQDRIFEGIRSCRYFLPLISAAADQFDEKFFRREWRAAIERSTAIMGREFVVPIIIDQDFNPRGYARVPRQWSEHIDFGHAPGGIPDERTRDLLKTLIRNQRRMVA